MQCNQTGTCLNGCIKGWYDPDCLQNCPKGCADSDCNQQSGFCNRGCIQGYFGDSFTVPCPQTCKMLHVHRTLGIVCLMRMENMAPCVHYTVQRTVMEVKNAK